jgi:hypothetical protein
MSTEAPVDPRPDQPPPPFRIVHYLYGITLLASSAATFGGSGILPGMLIVGAWAYIFTRHSRPRALFEVCVVIMLGMCVISMLTPAVQSAREASRRSRCRNNLKQIGLALHNYHDTYESFPPAYIADENGRPMHSWRVLLLPYLDEAGLYDSYHFDEPWNGPNNIKLAEFALPVFQCPAEEDISQATSYVAVVGPNTAWPGTEPVRIKDVTDGTATTIMLVEVADSGIHWMEPRDLNLEDALRLLASTDPQSAGGHRREEFFFDYYFGRGILFADGSVHFVSHGVDRNVWSALLTLDDGGPRADWEAGAYGPAVTSRKLKLGNCVRLAMFVCLVFFPLPWVWINPTSAAGVQSDIAHGRS